MSKVVIFGTGSLAEVIHFYLTHDSPHEVVAFTAHLSHMNMTEFHGLPVMPFESLQQTHPPSEYKMYVAVGYLKLNTVRAAICDEARKRGYELITYISSKCTRWPDLKIGDNCFVFEDNTIQPFVTIGNNNIIWSGNHIGHHVTIADHCFITSHVVISGHCKVGSYNFIGVNSTIRDSITIGDSCIIGAGALIMRPVRDKEVYAVKGTPREERTSDQIKM